MPSRLRSLEADVADVLEAMRAVNPQRFDYQIVDPTEGDDLVRFAHELGLEPGRPWSFPFPRATGKAFIYNETNLIARIPPA